MGAVKKVNEIYGSLKSGAPLKKGYHLPRAMMENADIARIINSTEVQSVVRAKLDAPKKFAVKKNPLKNKMIMARLNPGSMKKRALRKRGHSEGNKEQVLVQKKKKARVAASRKHNQKNKKGDATFYKTLMKAFETKAPKFSKKAKEDG